MRLRNVALFSFAGMLLSSATVYSFTPAQRPAIGAAVLDATTAAASSAAPVSDLASFEAGETLRVAGRVGHPRLVRGSSGETFVLLEVRAGEGSRVARDGSSHLAIVIDRSGSMKGDRIQNAIAGAVEAVSRLGDGDVLSVVAFDTRSTIVVPTTTIGPHNRDQIKAEIRKITLGGDTCISCGIEEGLRELGHTTGKVDRMIVLSDGDATAGVRDLAGFRALAERARAQGASVSTIGVGVTYNQKVLGAIALTAGGEHYFIENTASLGRVFQAEADKLRATVARDAEASIELGEGVEVERVFDRTFERRGRRVIVPLGSFARGDEKTVLLRVRVPTGAAGRVPVAGVSLGYSDLVRGQEGRCAGQLEASVGAEASEIDAVVGGRVQRSQTAAALLEANDLVEHGKLDEARRRLATQERELATAAAHARAAAPAGRRADVDRDFKGQASSLSRASSGLAKPSPAQAPRVLRENQEDANPFMK
jgi:Ca-activated chloride channel family protein